MSASNFYMPMIRLYVFLLDFLIPFLCDPDLQCSQLRPRVVEPARQATWAGGPVYDNPMPESTFFPSQGSMNSAAG